MRPFRSLMVLFSACSSPPQGTTPGLDVSAGQVVYVQACSSCHQTNGQGHAGAFPPLAGSEWVAMAPDVPVRIVLHGLNGEIRVNGATYNNLMLAHKDSLSDQEVADVLTFIRNAWGNRAAPITVEQVAAIRAQYADRTTPWTAAELKPR